MKVEFDTSDAKEMQIVKALMEIYGGSTSTSLVAHTEAAKPALAPTPAAATVAVAAAAPTTASAMPSTAASPSSGGVDLAAAKAATTAYLQKQGGRSPATAAAIYNRFGAANLKVATPEQLAQIVAALNNE